jgi:hypothetical protein
LDAEGIVDGAVEGEGGHGEVRGQGSGDGGQRSEVRGQRSEGRGQRSGVRGTGNEECRKSNVGMMEMGQVAFLVIKLKLGSRV